MITCLLLFLECFGYSQSNAQKLIHSKVVGGSIARVGQFPYQISLLYYGSHICGGSIIDAKTVLTAAHCVADDPNPSRYAVVAAVTKLTEYGNLYKVVKIRIPKEYTHYHQHDIAIVKLAKSITFNEKVKVIALETDNLGEGVDCVMSGWGQVHAKGDVSIDLKYAEMKTMSNHACQKIQPNNYPTIYSSLLCAAPKPQEGCCRGDSGGPLVANGKQIGIVSWTRSCAVGYPDVYTRVSSYSSWIQANRVD